MTEYNTIYEMVQAYADYCNSQDMLHGRTDHPEGHYYMYFTSGKINQKQQDTVVFCFTKEKNSDNKYPSYMIQTS